MSDGSRVSVRRTVGQIENCAVFERDNVAGSGIPLRQLQFMAVQAEIDRPAGDVNGICQVQVFAKIVIPCCQRIGAILCVQRHHRPILKQVASGVLRQRYRKGGHAVFGMPDLGAGSPAAEVVRVGGGLFLPHKAAIAAEFKLILIIVAGEAADALAADTRDGGPIHHGHTDAGVGAQLAGGHGGTGRQIDVALFAVLGVAGDGHIAGNLKRGTGVHIYAATIASAVRRVARDAAAVHIESCGDRAAAVGIHKHAAAVVRRVAGDAAVVHIKSTADISVGSIIHAICDTHAAIDRTVADGAAVHIKGAAGQSHTAAVIGEMTAIHGKGAVREDLHAGADAGSSAGDLALFAPCVAIRQSEVDRVRGAENADIDRRLLTVFYGNALAIQTEHDAILGAPCGDAGTARQRYVVRQIVVARCRIAQLRYRCDRLPRRVRGERVIAIAAARAADGVRIIMPVLGGEQTDPVFLIGLFRCTRFFILCRDELGFLLGHLGIVSRQRCRWQQAQAHGQDQKQAQGFFLHGLFLLDFPFSRAAGAAPPYTEDKGARSLVKNRFDPSRGGEKSRGWRFSLHFLSDHV